MKCDTLYSGEQIAKTFKNSPLEKAKGGRRFFHEFGMKISDENGGLFYVRVKGHSSHPAMSKFRRSMENYSVPRYGITLFNEPKNSSKFIRRVGN
eukprot:snap_masked-scaffold_58-processed-gene-0.57-mRNA-1 protein AED:1.00 eAED:1.00 QI:0/0/0/0/1/1/2/0/94